MSPLEKPKVVHDAGEEDDELDTDSDINTDVDANDVEKSADKRNS